MKTSRSLRGRNSCIRLELEVVPDERDESTGQAGDSFCEQEGSECPFYFGSLGATMTKSAETLALECADGTQTPRPWVP